MPGKYTQPRPAGRRVLSSFLFLFFIMLLFLSRGVFADQATLNWTAPATHTDGTPLTDLAGYKIHYGTASGSYTQVINVGNTVAYTVSSLAPGATYYFAATAYDAEGNESCSSNEVTKKIPALPVLTISKIGSGTVTGPAITCGTVCAATYNPGTVITLSGAPNADSTFGGWSGGGCSGTGPCVTTMNTDTVVTATFISVPTCQNQPVRIARATPVYFSTLQAAYDAAVTGDIIQGQALDFTEDLTFNRNISVTLIGGFDCSYTANPADTTLNGTITFSNGTVFCENIEL